MLIAHVAALALIALDCLFRAWRLQTAVQAAGQQRLGLGDALRLNLYGEAGGQLTPNRLGAEPARFFGLAESGIRPVPALVAIGVEVAAEWPMFIVMGLGLAIHFVPDWGAAARLWISRHRADDLLIVQAVVLLILIAVYLLQRMAKAGMIRHRVRRQWRVALAHVRRAPWWVLFVGALCTGGSFVARALVLPVLALGMPDPPAFGTMFFGSLALLHAVLLVPLPSGGGGLEVAFLSGFAGDFGPGHQVTMLLLWRFYTGILLTLLGVYFLIRRHGARATRELLATGWFRRRRK